jgi:drug/metabolite transporter superfamily protein YnfA
MDIALSLLVLTSIALICGAYVLFRRGKRGQAALMVLLAIVMAVNVAIWTWPMPSSKSLATSAGLEPS